MLLAHKSLKKIFMALHTKLATKQMSVVPGISITPSHGKDNKSHLWSHLSSFCHAFGQVITFHKAVKAAPLCTASVHYHTASPSSQLLCPPAWLTRRSIPALSLTHSSFWWYGNSTNLNDALLPNRRWRLMAPHQSQQLHPPQPQSGLTEYLCAEGSQTSPHSLLWERGLKDSFISKAKISLNHTSELLAGKS